MSEVLDASGARSPPGAGGVRAGMFGGGPAGHVIAAAMVYADIAWQWGYLRPGRTLTAAHAALRRGAGQWTAAADRTLADVTAAFGPPSLSRERPNPRWPASLACAPPGQADPLIVFDFWPTADPAGEDILAAAERLSDVPLRR